MDQTYFLRSGAHAYAAYLFCGNWCGKRGCGYGDSVYMPRTCYLLGGSAKKKVPGMGDMFAVVLAVGGVFLLATGGDPRTLSVPAECIYYSVLSAVFYAFCSIYPKQLMMTLDNSFLLMFGMLFGGIMGYMVDPVTDLGTFFHDDVLFDMFMIIICGTVIAFICYNAGLAWLTEEQTSVTATVEPAVSVIASYFLFGTTFGLFEGTGIIMVLLAILMPVMGKWHGN